MTKGCWNLKYKEGGEAGRTDREGYKHTFQYRKGLILHFSDRPFCLECERNKEITQTPNSYSEICPQCGQGVGSMWA